MDFNAPVTTARPGPPAFTLVAGDASTFETFSGCCMDTEARFSFKRAFTSAKSSFFNCKLLRMSLKLDISERKGDQICLVATSKLLIYEHASYAKAL